MVSGSGVKAAMTVKVKPPLPFPFHWPDEWQKWKRLEQFRKASGLSTESHQGQINMLLYTIEEEADDTLMSTKISDSNKKDYNKVIAKLDSFFSDQEKCDFWESQI